MTFSAMIYAAGFGTRMGSLTRDMPKPMVPLGGVPMIDHTIKILRDAGVSRIVANTHYLAERIAPHLKAQGVITHHESGDILDTGGGLRAALPLLTDGPVITINPDALWLGANPVKTLLDNWTEDMQALLLLVDQHRAIGRDGGGDFNLEDGQLKRLGPYIYGGAQILRPDRLSEIDAEVFSLNRYWDHLAATAPLHGILHPGHWCDIGTPKGLALAEAALANV